MIIKLTKVNVAGIILIIGLLIFGVITEVHPLYVMALTVNIMLLLYSYDKIESRSLLFAFGIAYFVFLLGREFLENYFNYQVEFYDQETNTHTYLCLFLGIICVWVVYNIFEKKIHRHSVILSKSRAEIEADQFPRLVRQISKYMYFATMPFAIVTRLAIAVFVRGASYAEYYTDFVQVLYGRNTLLYIIGRLETFMPVALGIFFSTLPSKKEARLVIIIYLIYCVLSLGAGNRGNFVLGIVYLFVFIVYMQGRCPEEHWFHRKQMLYAFLLVPIIAILGTVYDLIRSDLSFTNITPSDALIKFFYDQGVSITAIKHAFELEDMLPKQGPYLLEFIHSGVLARLLGITVYHGNSVEHALYGGSFTHSLAYTVMKTPYLAGRGTGTSFLAELYYDLKYFGVIAGSALYGWIFSKIQYSNSNKLFIRSLVFVLVTQFLWAPRGSYTGFLTACFAPATIGTYAIVWGISKLRYSRKS